MSVMMHVCSLGMHTQVGVESNLEAEIEAVELAHAGDVSC